MYCTECGSKLDENAIVCPYCGEEKIISNAVDEKDLKIQELEKKIIKLEESNKERRWFSSKKAEENRVQPWIFIFPLVFFVLFFVFFIILVAIR
ncbi:MAG: zinc-ribbon domain-containing protein [Promethearchaeota archaeon]